MSTRDATQPVRPPGPRHRAERHAERQRWWRGVPSLVWAAVALHVGVMIVFALLYPAYLSFDEKEQVGRILTTQAGDIAPAPGTLLVADGVASTFNDFFRAEQPPPLVGHSPTKRVERPTFDSVGGGGRTGQPVTMVNQLSQHPPGFYLLGAGFLDAIPGSSRLAWDQTVSLLRLLDIALIAPLPLLCWGAARRFCRGRVASIAAAFAPLLVPALERLGASVNNDNLLILAASVLLYLLAKVLHGDLRIRTATGVAVCLAIAFLTKGLALIFPPVVALAYLVGWRRAGGSRRDLPWASVAIVVGGVVVGGLWWLRNLLLYQAVQPSGLPPAVVATSYPSLPAGQHGQFGDFVRDASSAFVRQFWGALGLPLPPQLPDIVVATVTVVSLLLAVAAFALARGARLQLLTMALTAPLLIGLVSVHSWHEFYRTGRVVGFQGRYLYEGFVGLAVLAAVGLDRLAAAPALRGLARRAMRWGPLVVVVAALAMEAVAIVEIVNVQWLGQDHAVWSEPGQAARTILAYSPWLHPITIGVFVLSVLTAITAVGVAVAPRRARAT